MVPARSGYGGKRGHVEGKIDLGGGGLRDNVRHLTTTTGGGGKNGRNYYGNHRGIKERQGKDYAAGK